MEVTVIEKKLPIALFTLRVSVFFKLPLALFTAAIKVSSSLSRCGVLSLGKLTGKTCAPIVRTPSSRA